MSERVMKSTWRTSSRSIRRRISAVFLSWLLLADKGVCLPHQEFREVPESVQVEEGQDVFLRCAVDGQQGKVQWTKDGFALGFERDVPGYPRYAYSGDSSVGEHHLIINDITPTEDGEYQCQVGPTDQSPPMWAAANVTVLLAPKDLRITNWSDGGTIQVVGGNMLSLECVVSGGRPPATLWWYMGNTNLGTDHAVEELEVSSHPRRWNVRSQVDIRVEAKDDGKILSCEADHPALRDNGSSLSSSVTLSVLHPPGRPVISGYQEGQIWREGEPSTLTCRAPGGNPKPRILWKRKGVTIDNSTFLDSVGVVNAHMMVPSKEDDGATYECIVLHELLEEPFSDNVTLTVYYPPAYVSLTGPSQVEEGGSISLTCESSESNPSSELIWKVQGQEVHTAKSSVGQISNGGWVTSSDLNQYVVRPGSFMEITVECTAENPAFQKHASKMLVITVTKPPSPPSWETDLGGKVIAGSILQLLCSSVGGYPPPTLRLYKEDDVIPSKVERQDNLTRASSRVKIKASDNGAKFTCEVTSEAIRRPSTTSTRLAVVFGPLEMRGWTAPHQVEEGALINLFCETSSSLPPSNITWNIENMIAVEPSVHYYPGIYGGTSTRSQLQMRAAASDDGRVIECTADNGIGFPVSATFSMHVIHAPIWIKEPSPQINAQENSNVVISALAKSNPGPPSYQWQRGKDVFYGNDELQLEHIKRSQSGNYTVSASNDRGTLRSTFYLNVQYGPELLPLKDLVIADIGGSVGVRCIARANPPARVTWSRTPHFQEYNKTQILSSGIGKATLAIQDLKGEDTGVYYCHAANFLGYSLPVKTKIIVKQAVTSVQSGNSFEWSPENVSGGVSRSWTGEGLVVGVPAGGVARLECRVRAAPQPKFVWSRRDGLIFFKSDKYYIHDPQLLDGLVIWRSVLEIRRVTQDDYMQYKCTASNSLGSQTIQITLTTPTHPLQPKNLNVTRITNASVSLSWTPNFSGGQPDGYTVKYRATGDTNYQYADVSGGRTTKVKVGKLLPNTEYSFTLQATNHYGTSNYIPAIYVRTLAVSTSEELTTYEVAPSNSNKSPLPGNMTLLMDPEGADGARTLTTARSGVTRLILLIMTLTGTALLVLNIAIIACFVRRRSQNRRPRVTAPSKVSLTDTGGGSPTGSTPGHGHSDILLSLTTMSSNSISRSPTPFQEDQQKMTKTATFTDLSTSRTSPVMPLLNGGVITSDTTLLTISPKPNHQQGRPITTKHNLGLLAKSTPDVVVIDTSLSSKVVGGNYDPEMKRPESRKEDKILRISPVNMFPNEPDQCSLSSSIYDNASSLHTSLQSSEEAEELKEVELEEDVISSCSSRSISSRRYCPSHVRPLVSSVGFRNGSRVKSPSSSIESQLKVPTLDEVQQRLQEHIQRDIVLHKQQQKQQQHQEKHQQQQQQQQQEEQAMSQEYSSLSPSALYSLTPENFDAKCFLSSFTSAGSTAGYATLGPRSRRPMTSQQRATLQRPSRTSSKVAKPRTVSISDDEGLAVPSSARLLKGRSSPLYEIVGVVGHQRLKAFPCPQSPGSICPVTSPSSDTQPKILQKELPLPSAASAQGSQLSYSGGISPSGILTLEASSYRHENSGSSGYSSSPH